MNESYKITSKGQITIPKQLREAIGLRAGGQAQIVQLDDRTIGLRVPLSIESIRQKIGAPSHKQALTNKELDRLRVRGL